ncbi:rab-GTPase-TBC domain-containing protein [Cercophora newfieldiana]|uniref:Rab-GTPase-TBC domain-containing protein n=1 Tax=Cercophora newfieldiana TaxID=92897 RepID=A0AA39YRU7_9PEZI|nr:rab-GTPase-TBC domain-containing protein [Cercophora newfieldiana]
MPSPTKELKESITLFPPPSPNTHRALRRLQSAHSLGAKAAYQPSSLISQQRLQQQQHQLQQQQIQHQQHQQQPQQTRPASPPRRHASTNRSPQRGRANSDAPMMQFIPPGSRRSSVLSRRSLAADSMSLERLLRDGPPGGDVEGALESTRFKVLDQGIKTDSDGMSSLRIYVWLILLNAPVLETDAYLALIHRGASPAYSKIRNDTFRTLTTDPLFRRRVSEASLIRLLNAIAWRLTDAREERAAKDTLRDHHGFTTITTAAQHHRQYPSVSSSSRQSLPVDSHSRPGTGYDSGSASGGGGGGGGHPASSPAAKNRARALTLTTEGSESGVAAASEPGTYVQGMNVLAAPFLYAARSEAEAFIGFHQLLTQELPGYIRGAMDGVHKGLALVDKVLAIVDPKLSLYLLSKSLSAEIYAFPSVLTLCACTPPLPEVLRLWDFLFAYGPHLNILCIVAQLVLIRTKIMESASPNKLLRSFPALQAEQIKGTTLTIVKMIPDDVYAEIVAHAR